MLPLVYSAWFAPGDNLMLFQLIFVFLRVKFLHDRALHRRNSETVSKSCQNEYTPREFGLMII